MSLVTKIESKIKKIREKKILEENLKCVFVRINPDEKDFSAYVGLVKYINFLMSLKKEK